MKKKGYERFDHTVGPYPESHSIDGEKMPPDGEKQPQADEGNPPHMTDRAFGICQEEGNDFGPLIDHLGDGLFHSFDLDFTHSIPYSTGGVHPYTGLLLFSLALNMRPDVIVETGTFIGYSTFYLAKACEVGRKGKVYTFDPDQDMIAEDVKNNINVECIEGRTDAPIFTDTLKELGEVDFAFIDSWKRLAFYEFTQIDPYLVEGGIIAFHDTQLLNSGKELYQIISVNYPQYEQVLFTGIPHQDDPHHFHGNADHRGLYVLRKKPTDQPFLNVADANNNLYGSHQVMPQMRLDYLPIVIQEVE